MDSNRPLIRTQSTIVHRNTTGRCDGRRELGATRRAGSALVCLVIVGLACDVPTDPGEEPLGVERAALLAHLEVLAADSLLGRGSGSPDEDRAADYIREVFAEFGLQAGASEYLQRFTIPFPVNGQSAVESQNVLAVLPGAGQLAGQWVVLGAHYDHVGFGHELGSDSIYNGADDNASGTALLLELARALATRYATAGGGASRRSIMFQTYGAEEVGLVGSSHFCAQPTVPLDSVMAMVNFDMVGRLEDRPLMLIGTSSSTSWEGLVTSSNTHSLPLTYETRIAGNSDHWCFFQRRLPVLMLHTGLHAQYHQPTDDVALIDLDGMERIGSFAGSLITDLLVRPDRIPFAP